MQPIQYNLGCPAAKDKSITHAAAAPSNLDAANSMRSAETELQSTKRTTYNDVRNCRSKTGSRLDAKTKKDFKALSSKFSRVQLDNFQIYTETMLIDHASLATLSAQPGHPGQHAITAARRQPRDCGTLP